MVVAGYSKNFAHNPHLLTNSKGWQELMQQYLPDALLARKHKELLMVPKKVRHFKKGELESEYTELDSNAIGKGLDMAYKLKKRYGDMPAHQTLNQFNFSTMTDEQLNRVIERLETGASETPGQE